MLKVYENKELTIKFNSLPVLPELKEYFDNATGTAFIVGGALRDIIQKGDVRNDIDIMISPKSKEFPNGLNEEEFEELMITIWNNHSDNETEINNIKENHKYGNIYVYKNRNWIVNHENHEIQISYNPKLIGFENFVSESVNCILFNGKEIFYDHNAIDHAKNSIFISLHQNKERINKFKLYGFKQI